MFDQPSDAPQITSEKSVVIRSADTPWITSRHIYRLARERVKRTADVLLASALILFTLPLAAFVCLAIKLDSPGPVLTIERGRNRAGQPYSILKFRTAATASLCVSGSTRSGREQAVRVGDFLRYSRIEELPQLFNVLRGEMTLTGALGRTRAFEG